MTDFTINKTAGYLMVVALLAIALMQLWNTVDIKDLSDRVSDIEAAQKPVEAPAVPVTLADQPASATVEPAAAPISQTVTTAVESK